MPGQNMTTGYPEYNTGNPGRKSISRKYVGRQQDPTTRLGVYDKMPVLRGHRQSGIGGARQLNKTK